MTESLVSLTCLLLSKDAAVESAVRAALAASGIDATVFTPRSTQEALELLRQTSPSFLVVKALQTPDEVDTLVSDFGVSSVFYPTLAVSTEALSAEERERLRRKGAHAILEAGMSFEATELTLFHLSRSRFWFRGRLEEVSLDEVVSTLSADLQTVLVEVACDHLPEIATGSQGSLAGSCLEPRADSICQGAVGRICLDSGLILRAETESLEGEEALRALMSLQQGRFVVAETFLRPLSPLRQAPSPTSHRTDAAGSPAEPDDLRSTPSPASSHESNPRSSGDSMKKLAAALAALPASYGGARSTLKGEVLAKTGNFDAETTAAATAIAREALIDVAGSLGLGSPQVWAFCHQAGSIFVIDGVDLNITVGQVTKNPESVLRRISANLAEMKS